MVNNKDTVTKLLSLAGININGNNPWDITVNNDSFYNKVMAAGLISAFNL